MECETRAIVWLGRRQEDLLDQLPLYRLIHVFDQRCSLSQVSDNESIAASDKDHAQASEMK